MNSGEEGVFESESDHTYDWQDCSRETKIFRQRQSPSGPMVTCPVVLLALLMHGGFICDEASELPLDAVSAASFASIRKTLHVGGLATLMHPHEWNSRDG